MLYVQDQDEADDITQEVFAKAFAHLDQFQERSSFYTWLFRIAMNTAKNVISHRSVRVPLHDIDLSDAIHCLGNKPFMKHVASPERLCDKEEVKADIQRQLNELPYELVETFYMRELGGLSYHEIADIMACPLGTVRSRLFRIRRLLN